MKKILLAMVLVLMLAIPAFATDPKPEANATATATITMTNNGQGGSILSPTATGGSVGAITNTNTANGGAGGLGGAGGSVGAITNSQKQQIENSGNSTNVIGTGIGNFSPKATATIEKGAVVNNNAPVNNNSVKTDIKNTVDTDINIGGGLLSKTLSPEATANQKQQQNNEQVIAPSQSIVIEAPKQALVQIPMAGTPELNFGAGKMDWNFATLLPKIGVDVLKSTDVVKVVLDTTANIKAKNLLPTLLKMKKAQMPLCYNVRLIIIKAEAQKSWNTGGVMSGGSSGLSATGVGSAVGGSLVPSFGGTKADDLYTAILVKIE